MPASAPPDPNAENPVVAATDAGSSHASAGDATAEMRDGIKARLAAIRVRIGKAAREAGRDPASVTLVAVSKFHPAAAVEAALACGQRSFGENRVQEAVEKFGSRPRGEGADIRLHLIGALQTNKALDAVQVADVIETLDRPRLADAIEAAAQRVQRLPGLLVQVNIGDEPQKAGVARAEADRFIADCARRFGTGLRGLMCIPPAGADPRPFFTDLAALAAAHGLAELSMGMSDDLEAAITAGATEVRIGTAIFGGRPPAT